MSPLDGLLSSKTYAQELVDEQGKDEGLWFIAESVTEALLQQELRKLHAAVEKDTKCQRECIKSLAKLSRVLPTDGSVN